MTIQQTAAARGRLPWFKADRAGYRQVMDLLADKPKAAKLLGVIVAHMDRHNVLVAPHRWLMDQTGIRARNTLKAAIETLAERDFLEILEQEGRGSPHVYIATKRVAWGGPKENQSAMLTGRILVRRADQSRLRQGELNLELPNGPSYDQ